MTCAGIVLAGGRGARFGSEIPKQFLELNGKAVILHSLDLFLQIIDKLIVVCHPDWISYFKNRLKGNRELIVCPGGDTRQASVYNGLSALEKDSPDLVIIHDGARPLLSEGLAKRCLLSAEKKGSGIAAVLSGDTLAIVKNNEILSYPDRSEIYRIQTPQAFHFKTLLSAHREAIRGNWEMSTDDSQLYIRTGKTVHVVEGENSNIKITRPEDLLIAQSILNSDT